MKNHNKMENQQQQNERRMMSEEYGTELGGCLVTMMVCAMLIIAIGIAGIIYLFT